MLGHKQLLTTSSPATGPNFPLAGNGDAMFTAYLTGGTSPTASVDIFGVAAPGGAVKNLGTLTPGAQLDAFKISGEKWAAVYAQCTAITGGGTVVVAMGE